MKNGRALLLVVLWWLLTAFPAAAQALQPASPRVAFVNSSGQLIVSSADGGYRWIITNPGETLAGDHRWSPDGDQLYFAVNTGGAISLRVASVSQQSVSEIGQLAGQFISRSPDGSTLFYQNPDGSYGLQGGASPALGAVRNDLGARYSGLWSDVGAVVAYWGYAGNSQLIVTDTADGDTLTLDSGRSAPITPLVWRPGTLQIIFRDAAGVIRLADVACLQSSCPANPLETGAALASADADVATDGTWLFFRAGDAIAAVNLGCVSSDSCQNSAIAVATNAAPQTALNVTDGQLVYTAYASNPNDPNDREVRLVNLSCVSNGACAPQTVVAGGTAAGALSRDGHFAVVETPGGLNTLDLTSGALAYLSDRGAPLTAARWQP